MKTSNQLILALLFVFVLILGVWGFVNHWEYELVEIDVQNQLVFQLLPYSNAFQQALRERVSLIDGLQAYAGAIEDDRIEETFDEFAAGLYRNEPGIRSVSIAPGGIQKYVYPLEKNRSMLGHNLLEDSRPENKKDIEQTLQTGKAEVSNPHELRNGGEQGLVVRKAVKKDGRFWGLVSIVLDMEPIYHESGFDAVSTFVFSMADEDNNIFFGPEYLENPISIGVNIAGDAWKILAVPGKGWSHEYQRRYRPFFYLTGVIALVSSCGLIFLVFKIYTLSTRARREQERYKNLFNSIGDTIVVADEQRRIVDINQPALRKTFGYELDELIDRKTAVLYADKQGYETSGREVFSRRSDSAEKTLELSFRRKDGSVFPAELSALKLYDDSGKAIGNIGIIKDITERINTQEKLEREIAEKDILAKEIHHRVKNNLNIVTSLLNLQQSEIDSVETAVQAFEDTANRIYSMALVHDSLYSSGSLSEVEMSVYIRRLTEELTRSLSGVAEVSTEFDLDDVRLDITRAIPCGILVNELVTNAIKHAFKDRKQGILTVSLKKQPDTIELSVGDNGAGLTDGFSMDTSTSLGMNLIQILTSQLGGRLTYTQDNGTTFSIEFPGVE